MDDALLAQLTLAQAAEQIHAGQLSPVDLVDACLDRIARLNPMLNAFLTVMVDEARRAARWAAEAVAKGDHLGPLHGIPIGVKDLIDVVGVRTTAGSAFLEDNIARDDAAVIRHLRAAGAIIIGKTHLHEYAIGATNANPHYGPACNPWNIRFSPGGSSGGSGAAVAASLCLGALGTDTGGSVRVPSALCGLTGLRPAAGYVSTRGVIPMSWTLDTVGPMAHSARDVALLLDVLDPRFNCSDRLDVNLSEMRIGVPVDDFFWQETGYQIVGAVRAAVETLAEMGAQIVDVSLPMFEEALCAAGVISLADAAAYHRERLEQAPERFGDDVRTRLERGARHSAVDYALARHTGREWRATLQAVFADGLSVLVLPTTPQAAPEIVHSEGVSSSKALLRFTYPVSLSGLPALSVPCGFTGEGLPVGMQLVAPNECTLLSIAHAYQGVTEWHTRRPAIL